MIVEATAIVQKEISNVYLTIVGNGQPSYIEMIQSKMKDLLKEGSYTYLPGCKHENLPALLQDKHFYIFPSTQPREGQSNSVTECMSYGIIPLASPQGFNRSTIGDDMLIVDELKAEAYADRICKIITEGNMSYYSDSVFKHFNENFTEERVFIKTLAEYKKIFETI